MKRFVILCFALLFLAGGSTSCNHRTHRFAQSQLWYQGAHTPGPQPYDVFYILPTCVWDRVDAHGDTLHYADPYNEQDRAAMEYSYQLAQSIFGREANFYAPYYRQVSLNSCESDSLLAARFPPAMEDVRQAFAYYLKYINQGRPFALAGFSQGALCVRELTKELTPVQHQRLIASYIIGYHVSAADTLAYPTLRPARGPHDTGVTICYNSVEGPHGIGPSLPGGALCINPINWTTTTTPAYLNDSVSVQVDTLYNVLQVKGLDSQALFVPKLAALFPVGNYHLQELTLYQEHLAQNLSDRYRAWAAASPPR